jgi:peroxiredoxin
MNYRNILFFILALIMLSPTSRADVLLEDTQGHIASFSSLKGKWVIINYWAAWCPTCVDEIPEFNRFYHHHKNDPIAVFGINDDDLSLKKQKKLIRKFDIQYPCLIHDPGKELGLGYIRALPATFLFNPQGKLVERLFGNQSEESLNELIEKNKLKGRRD